MELIADLADRYCFGEARVLARAEPDPRRRAQTRLCTPSGRSCAPTALATTLTSACSPTSSAALAATFARWPTPSTPIAMAAGTPRRSRLPVRRRRSVAQHVRLHERLRPPSRRQHRHPRRRQARRGVVLCVDRPPWQHAAGSILGPSSPPPTVPRVVEQRSWMLMSKTANEGALHRCRRSPGVDPFKARVHGATVTTTEQEGRHGSADHRRTAPSSTTAGTRLAETVSPGTVARPGPALVPLAVAGALRRLARAPTAARLAARRMAGAQRRGPEAISDDLCCSGDRRRLPEICRRTRLLTAGSVAAPPAVTPASCARSATSSATSCSISVASASTLTPCVPDHDIEAAVKGPMCL